MPPPEARGWSASALDELLAAADNSDTETLVLSFVQALLRSETRFGNYCKSFLRGSLLTLGGRCRDVLPLPPVELSRVATSRDAGLKDAVLEVALNATAAGLNFLYSEGRRARVPRRATRLHLGVYEHLLERLASVTAELHCGSSHLPVAGAFATMVGRDAATKFPPLVAERVDVVSGCGQLDPQAVLSPEHRRVLEDPAALFGERAGTLPTASAFAGGERAEYVHLVQRQLRADKLRLMWRPQATASVFTIGKKGKDTLREIWNGSMITEAAAAPPKPPFLANPAALADLEASRDRPLWVSGRDAQVFFDQLQAPAALTPFFGRPGLSMEELRSGPAPLTDEELAGYVLDPAAPTEAGALLAPVSRVWPMGFGWSSFIAQSYMLDCCDAAGFSRAQLVTEEGRLGPAEDAMLSIATDDVLHYLRGSRAEREALAEPPLAALDAEWATRGLVPNLTKAFDLEPSATALGMEIRDGVRLLPKGGRVCDLLAGCADLLGGAQASPREVAAFSGVLHWHNLANRPLFSCLHKLYGFTKLPKEDELRKVPREVVGELALNACLFALWSVDLTTPWLPRLPATDASGAFGFGYCLARCGPSLARRAAAHAAAGAHHFRLERSEGDAAEKPRAGACLRLPLRHRDFKVILRVRAKQAAHSGALEASAVVLALRRLGREARWHQHRGSFLVDAQAVLGALQKGRSSAGTLRFQVRQAGALSLACGWRWRYGYLPSESNPADAPSRGVRPTARRRRSPRPARCVLKLAKLKRDTVQTYNLLRRSHYCADFGSWSALSVTDDSDSQVANFSDG